jgi:hypothetical protein
MSDKPSLSFRLLVKLPSFIISEPYEVFFSVALFLTGITDIITPRASGAVGHALSSWQVYSWGSALILGSLVTLIGLVGSSNASTMHRLRVFREVERSGQLLLGVATCLWSLVIFHVGVVGVASGTLTLFLALIFIVRAAVLKGIEEYITNSKLPSISKGGDDA